MTVLSGPFSPSQTINDTTFVPFIIYVDVPSYHGNRWERIRQIEKYVNLVESTLVENAEATGYNLEISTPIKYTFSFGNAVARMTIIGHIEKLPTEVPNQPTAEVDVINASELKTGYGATVNGNRTINPIIDLIALELNNIIATLIPPRSVIAMDVCGIRYGKGGKSIQ